jgi:hypothetical protein
MKNYKIISGAFLFVNSMIAQDIPKEYFNLIHKADSLLSSKDYKNASFEYSAAFKINGWKALQNDRYNAACSWAMANYPDSAFFNLDRIAKKLGFKNYDHIIKDTDLNSLHNDKRWNPIIELVKQNRDNAEAKLNKPLVAQLDSVHELDQKYRIEFQALNEKTELKSKKGDLIWQSMRQADSSNLIKVKNILDNYGWLGADIVGQAGNNTLFLVIQHADLKTQEKYLPMLRDAVKKGNASPSGLAMLEDRIEIRNNRKQIYGSQIGRDPISNNYFVSPLIDPDNVDKRRAEVGLGNISEYVEYWGITWDIEQYKKDLPKIEAALKNTQK